MAKPSVVKDSSSDYLSNSSSDEEVIRDQVDDEEDEDELEAVARTADDSDGNESENAEMPNVVDEEEEDNEVCLPEIWNLLHWEFDRKSCETICFLLMLYFETLGVGTRRKVSACLNSGFCYVTLSGRLVFVC